MSELDHMDALAAEYVLGSLDFEERAQARNLLEADATFAAKVQLWERRFGELHLMVEAAGRARHCRSSTPARARRGPRANDGCGSPAPEALASVRNRDDPHRRGGRRAAGGVAICPRSRSAGPAAG